jgi:hypothetical protein
VEDMCYERRRVSGVHLIIKYDCASGQWKMEEQLKPGNLNPDKLKPANGTLLQTSGMQYPIRIESCELKNGDVITLGGAVSTKVKVRETPLPGATKSIYVFKFHA